jgi:hypothetical protein
MEEIERSEDGDDIEDATERIELPLPLRCKVVAATRLPLLLFRLFSAMRCRIERTATAAVKVFSASSGPSLLLLLPLLPLLPPPPSPPSALVALLLLAMSSLRTE